MKIGDIVTRIGANDRYTLTALSHPTHIGGMYYGVDDPETGRTFYIKSYQLELVESRG